ncbi:MAG: ATP-dependent sacrificial sulfur transferase LarE [Methanobacteriota archaeon]
MNVLARLLSAMKEKGSLAVGFSGGVDSAVLAAAAARALGDRAVAVTVDSESLPRAELRAAVELARAIGIRHEVVRSHEMLRAEYVANPTDRCYFCRQEMSAEVAVVARGLGCSAVAMGVNVSDLSEHRPGHRAMREAGIWFPLLELGLDKPQVRALAHELGLQVAEKPSMACLSSRIPHGEPITVAKLARIERAEAALHALGFRQVRVRSLGETARIEVGLDEVPRLSAESARVTSLVQAAGFASVEIDERGYRP